MYVGSCPNLTIFSLILQAKVISQTGALHVLGAEKGHVFGRLLVAVVRYLMTTVPDNIAFVSQALISFYLSLLCRDS